jgi:DNA-binding MurR/RpiR family transcriptional regulator
MNKRKNNQTRSSCSNSSTTGQSNPQERLATLSLKRQEIIRPVFESPRDYLLLSIDRLARELRSDPATLGRIVRELGFSDFKEFRQYLYELSQVYATSLDLIRLSQARKDNGLQAKVMEALDQEVKNLQRLLNSLDPQRLVEITRRIYRAKRILVVGGDVATSLVTYLDYHLTMLGLPVFAATTSGKAVYLSRCAGQGDLVFAISFRRGLRFTVEALRQARANGAYCVGLTDTQHSPISRYADESFIASINTPVYGPAYAAPIALLNALLAACANYRRDRTLAILKEIEHEQRHGTRWYED